MCVCVRARVAERDSKERHSKEEKSKRKDEDVVSSLNDILCFIGHY